MVQGVYGWRRRGLALLFSLVLMSLAPAVGAEPAPIAASQERPVVLGVLPFISPIALLKRFAPLRDFISEQSGSPVVLETAANYPEFIRRTGERRYDMVITAPHFVPLALEGNQYTVRATYATQLSAVILVRRNSDIRALSDLAGKQVATPPEQAIVTWVGAAVIDNGIDRGQPPHYLAYQSHNAAYSAVAGGEAHAAVVSVSLVEPDRLRAEGLRELGRSKAFPAMGILIATDLPSGLAEQLTNVLVNMSASARGRAVLDRIAYPGYRRADAAEFEPLRTFMPRVRAILEPRS